ncbi:hypothetical protein HDU91_003377, partial [Kappamyces sp. JEL0680]
MKWVVQDPVAALASLRQTGDSMVASAISELVRMGPQPDHIQMPHDTFKDGFSHYFASTDVMKVLVELASRAVDAMDLTIYLECIIDLLYSIYEENPPSPSLVDQFTECGGIEMLRSSSAYPGSHVLHSPNEQVAEVGQAIYHLLSSTDMYLRLCSGGCGKREETKDEFKICARCSEPRLKQYPSPLNFYKIPPNDQVTLMNFERLALDRLMVLLAIDSARIRAKADIDMMKLVEPVMTKHLDVK